MNNKFIVPIIASVISVTIGFGGGYLYHQKSSNNFKQQFRQTNLLGQPEVLGKNFTSNNVRLRNGNVPISGKIIKLDEKSITIQTRDNNNKIILTSENTKYLRNQESSLADLTVDKEITVIGNTTSDIVTAQVVNISN